MNSNYADKDITVSYEEEVNGFTIYIEDNPDRLRGGFSWAVCKEGVELESGLVFDVADAFDSANGAIEVLLRSLQAWHQHQCAMFHWPKTRTDWWQQKISANRAHDEAMQDKLRELGWRVLLVWECALKGKSKMPPDQLTADISHWLRNGTSFAELPVA